MIVGLAVTLPPALRVPVKIDMRLDWHAVSPRVYKIRTIGSTWGLWQPPPVTDAPLQQAFAHVDTWVFDVDNTLYPPSCGLLTQAEQRMTTFVASHFLMSEDEARVLRRGFREKHGTTLRGLMVDHGVSPDDFLDYVHELDHRPLAAAPQLAELIASLPGRKLVYTNASRSHAERVAASLGLADVFEDVVCISRSQFIPKHEAAAYDNFVRMTGVDPKRAAMFEDTVPNLAPAHDLGFTTVLVTDIEQRLSGPPPSFVHHVTGDLAGFLRALSPV